MVNVGIRELHTILDRVLHRHGGVCAGEEAKEAQGQDEELGAAVEHHGGCDVLLCMYVCVYVLVLLLVLM